MRDKEKLQQQIDGRLKFFEVGRLSNLSLGRITHSMDELQLAHFEILHIREGMRNDGRELAPEIKIK